MKKMFSASLVLLLMCATMSFSAPLSEETIIEVEASEKCENVANNVMHAAFNMIEGITPLEVAELMNIAYALCEGYTAEEIAAAN
jgi:hypothetical protein